MDNYSGNKEYNIYRDIRNRTNRKLNLEYQLLWRDRAGLMINNMSGWQTMSIDPRQVETVESVGKVIEAFGFRLTVREVQ